MVSPEALKLNEILRNAPKAVDMDLPHQREAGEHAEDMTSEPEGVTYEEAYAVDGLWATPQNWDGYSAIMYLYGGGYVISSPHARRKLAGHLASASGARALVPRYHLSPERPFPSAVEDAAADYQWLLGEGGQAERAVVAGDSSAGGLTVATMLKLRDDGRPLPAGGVPISPWVDLRSSGFGGCGSILGRMVFYILVFPGVVLHEGAHYLACLFTGTRVSRFAPFSPGRKSNDGRLILGYVRHERRAFPIGAAIGLAPILLNPLALLIVTALLTPLTFQEVAKPTVGVVAEGIFASGFLIDTPLLAAVWVYLSLCFALGSVPSREDLSGLPMVLLVFGGGIFLIVLLRMGSERVLSSAVYDLSALAAGLYALPATVAAIAALTMGLGGRTIRH